MGYPGNLGGLVPDRDGRLAGVPPRPGVRDLHAPNLHYRDAEGLAQGTVPSMCAYLIRMAGTIAAEDWAGVLLDELIDAEKRLYRAVDRPAERWYAGRCGHVEEAVPHDGTVCGCACHHGAGILCDVPGGCGLEFAAEPAAVCTAELWADDRPVVRCDTCGSTYEVQARRDSLLAEARDRTASVRVLARVVTTLGAATWVRRGSMRGSVRGLRGDASQRSELG